jgi:uncharacterized membrane protein HdeD (DUF308 family)
MFKHWNEYEWQLLLWQPLIIVFYIFIGYLLYLIYKLVKKNLNK